jgi:hypothetical protein
LTLNGTTYTLPVTTNSAGDPLIRIPRNLLASLAPGKSVALSLRFSNPTLTRFSYNTETFSDSAGG